MFGKIEGQRLNLAKMHIANYCMALEQEAGAVNVNHVVANINERFKLVPSQQTDALASDVGRICDCFSSQEVSSIDRGSYWKWKANSALEAKAEVEKELKALQA